MSEIEKINPKPAPDFELIDSEGTTVRFSSFKGRRQIVLIFNRGFA